VRRRDHRERGKKTKGGRRVSLSFFTYQKKERKGKLDNLPLIFNQGGGGGQKKRRRGERGGPVQSCCAAQASRKGKRKREGSSALFPTGLDQLWGKRGEKKKKRRRGWAFYTHLLSTSPRLPCRWRSTARPKKQKEKKKKEKKGKGKKPDRIFNPLLQRQGERLQGEKKRKRRKSTFPGLSSLRQFRKKKEKGMEKEEREVPNSTCSYFRVSPQRAAGNKERKGGKKRKGGRCLSCFTKKRSRRKRGEGSAKKIERKERAGSSLSTSSAYT